MAKSRREENRQKEPLKTAKEKKDEKREKKNSPKRETSFNFTNQYRNTNFTDFHQLILSIETC
jgi:hypothetical protein